MDNVILTEDAIQDLKDLPTVDLKQECLDTLDKLDNNIHLGKPLFNKNGKDLNGYFKLYFDNAQYRVIYQKLDNEMKIIGVKNIAEVVGIGKRDKEEIYNLVNQRINQMKNKNL